MGRGGLGCGAWAGPGWGGRRPVFPWEGNFVGLKIGGYLLPAPQKALEGWKDDEEEEKKQAE